MDDDKAQPPLIAVLPLDGGLAGLAAGSDFES